MARAIKNDLFRESSNPIRAHAFDIIRRKESAFVDLALATRRLANSWRNFDVGAVGVGLRPILRPGSNPWFVRFAANTKARVGEKYCGEQRIMDVALRKAISEILWFYVAGEPQLDHGSGKSSETLTPCERCRWRMRVLMQDDTSPIIQPDMQILSINCKTPTIRESWTVRTLHEFHEEHLE